MLCSTGNTKETFGIGIFSILHTASAGNVAIFSFQILISDGPGGDTWRPRNSALEIDYPSLDTGEKGKEFCPRKQI